MKYLIFAALFLSTLSFAAQHYPTNFAPSAQLQYAVKATRGGFSLNGEADMNWQVTGSAPDQTYAITTTTRAMIFGKILEANSRGSVNAYGLAPEKYEEISLNKPALQTTFDRKAMKIRFPETAETYAIKGGEQDRTSAIWQLVSIARGSPKKFIPKSQWSFLVANRRSVDKWTFTVEKNVTLSTPLGKLNTIHISKASPDPNDRRIDIWLAPSDKGTILVSAEK